MCVSSCQFGACVCHVFFDALSISVGDLKTHTHRTTQSATTEWSTVRSKEGRATYTSCNASSAGIGWLRTVRIPRWDGCRAQLRGSRRSSSPGNGRARGEAWRPKEDWGQSGKPWGRMERKGIWERRNSGQMSKEMMTRCIKRSRGDLKGRERCEEMFQGNDRP